MVDSLRAVLESFLLCCEPVLSPTIEAESPSGFLSIDLVSLLLSASRGFVAYVRGRLLKPCIGGLLLPLVNFELIETRLFTD